MSDHEPLECPFCGGDAQALDLRAAWCVACSEGGECGACGPMRDTEAEAVTAWNAPILERRKLKAAMGDAVTAMRVFHGEPAWDIYWNNSPECKRIREALEVTR